MSSLTASKIPIPIKGISCQDLLLYTDVCHSGFLRRRHAVNKVLQNIAKSSAILKWPQCYVILREGCIYVYQHERATTPLKAASLYGFDTLRPCDDSEVCQTSCPHAFVLASQLDLTSRTFYFNAATQADMNTWMSCIQQQMNLANNSSSGGFTAGTMPSPSVSLATLGREPLSHSDRPVLKVPPKPKDAPPPVPNPMNELIYSEESSDQESDYEDIDEDKEDDHNSPVAMLGNVNHPLNQPATRQMRPGGPGNVLPTVQPAPAPRPAVKPKPGADKTTDTSRVPMTYAGGGYYAVERRHSDGMVADTAEYSCNDSYPGFNGKSRHSTSDEPVVERAYWRGEARDAEKLMKRLTAEGVFMLRAASQAGKETLMVRSFSEVRKYHIMNSEDGRFCLQQAGPFFDSRSDLINHYSNNFLPMRDTKLAKPFTAYGHNNR